MTIELILAGKGRGVRTVRPDATVGEAMRRMHAERVGALVVSEDGARIAGIVTDRGVLWGLAEGGTGLLGEPVGRVMTADVLTCRAGDPVGAVMALMTDKRVRHVPVVDGAGRLAGIVSIGDVVKHRLDEIQAEAEALREYIGASR